MALRPGPIEPLDPGRFPLQVEEPEFERSFAELEQTFAGVDSLLGRYLADLSSHAGEDWNAALAEPLNSAGLAVEEERQPGAHPTFTDEAEASAALGQQLTDSEAAAPPEASQDVPAELLPAELAPSPEPSPEPYVPSSVEPEEDPFWQIFEGWGEL